MTIADKDPFDTSPVRFDLGLVRDDPAESRAKAEALRSIRQRLEQWGVARGYEFVAGGLVRIVDSVEVTITLCETTAELCAVRSSAHNSAELRLRLEPRSWTDWIAARLGRGFETADRAFDEHWHVETDNDALAKRLLAPRVRAALTNHPIWCRVTYANGQIELHSTRATNASRARISSRQRRLPLPSHAPLRSPRPLRTDEKTPSSASR